MEGNIFKGNSRKVRETKTERAGITFPVSRVLRRMRKGNYANRIRVGSLVYAAVVLEYLVAEILESAGNEAALVKKKRISPRHIMFAIRKDEELHHLLKDVVIAESGVLPYVHSCLIKSQVKK